MSILLIYDTEPHHITKNDIRFIYRNSPWRSLKRRLSRSVKFLLLKVDILYRKRKVVVSATAQNRKKGVLNMDFKDFKDFVNALVFFETALIGLSRCLKNDYLHSVTQIAHTLIVCILGLQLFGLLISGYIVCEIFFWMQAEMEIKSSPHLPGKSKNEHKSTSLIN